MVMKFANRADWIGAWKVCNWRGRYGLLADTVKWHLWYRWERPGEQELSQQYYDQVLNPIGAACPCARSISVWCSECEGNRR